jgi:hypothetical protein
MPSTKTNPTLLYFQSEERPENIKKTDFSQIVSLKLRPFSLCFQKFITNITKEQQKMILQHCVEVFSDLTSLKHA